MAAKARPGRATTRTRETGFSPITMLTELVKQGTESIFATQRIVFDLVMRQNANTMNAIGERLAALRSAPATLTEVTGEGISNFIAAQRVLLHLAQRENEIVMTGVQEQTGGSAPISAVVELVRRSVDNYIDMQQHFLTLASKETDGWIDAMKSGKAFAGVDLVEVAREGIDNFVRSQKKFLDVIAEETEHAIEGKNGKPTAKTELAELARQGAEAFIDAQKKLLDVAAQQVEVNLKAARETVQAVNPFQPMALGDLTRHAVDAFVAAQKALLDVVSKPVSSAIEAEEHPTPRRPKGTARKRARAVKHAAAAASA
jgi:hypothetical protein